MYYIPHFLPILFIFALNSTFHINVLTSCDQFYPTTLTLNAKLGPTKSFILLCALANSMIDQMTMTGLNSKKKKKKTYNILVFTSSTIVVIVNTNIFFVKYIKISIS